MTLRYRAHFGSFILSVIAGPLSYSTPRAELPRLGDYAEVEVGILDAETGELLDGKAVAEILGERHGEGMSSLWSRDDTTAAYVPMSVLSMQLIPALNDAPGVHGEHSLSSLAPFVPPTLG